MCNIMDQTPMDVVVERRPVPNPKLSGTTKRRAALPNQQVQKFDGIVDNSVLADRIGNRDAMSCVRGDEMRSWSRWHHVSACSLNRPKASVFD